MKEGLQPTEQPKPEKPQGLIPTLVTIFQEEHRRFKESTTPDKMLPIYEAISKHLP